MIAASMPAPDFQGSLPKSIPIEQNHETVIDPGREKTPKLILNISAICTKITSFLSLHSTVLLMDACERRKQTWSTDIFVKSMH